VADADFDFPFDAVRDVLREAAAARRDVAAGAVRD
jgi:hypothetical protein